MPDATSKPRRAAFLLCAALSALVATPAIAAPPPSDAALERMRADLVKMGEGSGEPQAYVTAARAYEAACARRWTEADWRLARCRTQVVDALLNDAQANEAIALLRKIIPQLEAGGAKAEAALATAQSDLAGVLPIGEADAEADKLFATALATRLRLHGEVSNQVVDTLIESANRLVERGKFAEAEALVLRADKAASGMDLPPACGWNSTPCSVRSTRIWADMPWPRNGSTAAWPTSRAT